MSAFLAPIHTWLFNKIKLAQDLEKDIVKNKSKLETWKRVTYLTKKDWSPYKIMAKNFENAKYGTRFNTFYLEISCRYL